MPIRPVATALAAPAPAIAPRVRTRVAAAPVTIMAPVSPPPTLATWAVDVEVVDATKMHERAVNVMLGAHATPAEINARLMHDSGVVDIAECLKVLFDFTFRSVEQLTECKVHPPQLYLEPLPAARAA